VAEEEGTDEFLKQLERSKTLSFEDSKTVERNGDAEWIEPSEDSERIDLSKVEKTYHVQGFDLEEPEPPEEGIEEKVLKGADETADMKRNRNEYKVFCPTCRGTGRCPGCNGRKRVMLFFKCKKCLGTGRCPDCDTELMVPCPQCGEEISIYSTTCRKCGTFFTCPECGAGVPALATRCMMCREEFKCRECGKDFPAAYTGKCPHCGRWNRDVVV